MVWLCHELVTWLAMLMSLTETLVSNFLNCSSEPESFCLVFDRFRWSSSFCLTNSSIFFFRVPTWTIASSLKRIYSYQLVQCQSMAKAKDSSFSKRIFVHGIGITLRLCVRWLNVPCFLSADEANESAVWKVLLILILVTFAFLHFTIKWQSPKDT